MRKILFLLSVIFIAQNSDSQPATIHFNIKSAKTKTIGILNNDYSNAYVMFKERYVELPLVKGKGIKTFLLMKPVFINVQYDDDSLKKNFNYSIFLSPGDDLNFSADIDAADFTFAVTGKGSSNNQSLIQQIKDNIDPEAFRKDSLPYNVFKAIERRDSINHQTLREYIQRYHPTEDFVKIYSLLVQYFPVQLFIEFNGEQKYEAGEPYRRNRDRWQAIEDSLIQVNSLNNAEILNVSSLVYFLPGYLLRVKERLWDESNENPKTFFQEWYRTDETAGKKIMEDDMENDLRERIINKYFTGKTAEFLYATVFKDAMKEKQDNIPGMFKRFQQKYPTSQYTKYIEPFVKEVQEKEKRKVNDNMILIENTDSLRSFDDVLKLVKGKAVLLDMWGTWCGPCRESLLANSDSIKTHFQNKGLDYLYIANFDESNPAKWKQLIPYYNLSGTNILASKILTEDIMKKINSHEYPTYVIIKKDGSFELSKAGYPMHRNVLYKQLEDALKD
jgi:thiol-disulfide isomerase/thioredoxin